MVCPIPPILAGPVKLALCVHPLPLGLNDQHSAVGTCALLDPPTTYTRLSMVKLLAPYRMFGNESFFVQDSSKGSYNQMSRRKTLNKVDIFE